MGGCPLLGKAAGFAAAGRCALWRLTVARLQFEQHAMLTINLGLSLAKCVHEERHFRYVLVTCQNPSTAHITNAVQDA